MIGWILGLSVLVLNSTSVDSLVKAKARPQPAATAHATSDGFDPPISLQAGVARRGGTVPIAVQDSVVQLDGARLFLRTAWATDGTLHVGGVHGWDLAPLVVIHGGPGLDHSYFLPWLDDLPNYGKVVYFDQRGCGGSERMADTTKYAMAVTVEDVDAIREHLGAEKLCILGFSYGGFVALKYALAHPEHVEKLILSDTAPSMAFAAEAKSLQKARQTPAQKQGFADLEKRTDLTKDQRLLEEFKLELPYNFHHPRTPEFMNAIAEKIRYGAEAGEYIGRHDLPTYDVTKQLSSIDVPTLVMVGDDDIVTPPSQAHVMAEGINAGKKHPNATLKIIPGAGHLSMIDNQEAFNTNIIEFLTAPSPHAAH